LRFDESVPVKGGVKRLVQPARGIVKGGLT